VSVQAAAKEAKLVAAPAELNTDADEDQVLPAQFAMPFSFLGPLTILVPRAQVTEQADFDAGDFDVRFPPPLAPWIRKPRGAHW